MVNRTTIVRPGFGIAQRVLSRSVSLLCIGLLTYTTICAQTGGAFAVDVDSMSTETTPAPILIANATGPVISGNVSGLFDDKVFTILGSEEILRSLPPVNINDFTTTFDAARISIASARDELKQEQELANKNDLQNRAAMQIAAASVGSIPRLADRIDVAMISPSDALSAIESAAGQATNSAIPRPIDVPSSLAYGRANTPATEHKPVTQYSEREQWCLATGIYFEARGESYRGQVAVAQVIMNRVAHENYPSTICGVVYQNQHRRNACQFSFACDGIPDRIEEPGPWKLAQEITQSVLNKEIFLTEVADATHYHASYVRPSWARNMSKVTKIGLHEFYRFKTGWAFG